MDLTAGVMANSAKILSMVEYNYNHHQII
jgi:hypothetical protein